MCTVYTGRLGHKFLLTECADRAKNFIGIKLGDIEGNKISFGFFSTITESAVGCETFEFPNIGPIAENRILIRASTISDCRR